MGNGFADLFRLGMKRGWPGRVGDVIKGEWYNLGSGNAPIPEAINLDLPDWEARLPIGEPGAAGRVTAFHVLEHLEPEALHVLITNIDAVLAPGGEFLYCVPYAGSPLAFTDANHRTFWTEETMDNLLGMKGGYSGAGPETRLRRDWVVIAGICSQNLAVLGRIVKT